MSRRCHLTIYEPKKEPRVVELPVNQSNSDENDLPVYNEDGTILKHYQLYLETIGDQLIKVPCANEKSKERLNILKFWKELTRKEILPNSIVSDTLISDNRSSNSIIGDIPVSEKARNLLQKCMMHSAKKEKKIARVKELRNAVADRKLKNKLKKQRRKKQKRFFSEDPLTDINCSLLATSVPPKRNSFVDLSSNEDSVIEIPTKNTFVAESGVRKNIEISELKASNEEQCINPDVQNIPKFKKNRRSSRAKKLRKMSLQNQNEANKSNNNMCESNGTSAAEASPSLEKTAVSLITSSRTVESNSPAVRWKASEPALDFIPVTKSNENKCDDFLPFNMRKNSRNRPYSKFFPNTNSRSQKNEFIGLSQKAYFLQC